MHQYGKSFASIEARNMQALYRLRVTRLARLVTIFSQARKASGVNNDAHRRSIYLFRKSILTEIPYSYNNIAIISKLFSTAWQETCFTSCKVIFFATVHGFKGSGVQG